MNVVKFFIVISIQFKDVGRSQLVTAVDLFEDKFWTFVSFKALGYYFFISPGGQRWKGYQEVAPQS